jgi:hypothetical protein
MKMVKSLLLVSAAGVVAAPGAQAADLPVKAKPVEYVRICSLYGAGFYYIPGTDICMKVGGYVRYQVTVNPGASISAGPFSGTGGRSTRLDSQDWAHRTRAIATFDTRQQTPYGTLRTYLLIGFSQDSTIAPTTSPPLYATRAFIQFAGFTFGKATSFFDFASTAAVAYNAGMLHNSDTGDAGQMVAAYTAQLGNGVSATISAEQTRRLSTVFLDGTGDIYSLSSLANPAGNNLWGLGAAGVGTMDFVANLRIDQAWGSAQVSAAVHNISAGYYGTTEITGHPEEEWGWAASAGLRLNFPMIGPGDYFQAQVIYSEGATGYLSQTPRGSTWNKWHADTVGYGFWEDAVYTVPGGLTGGAIERTTGWSAFASYEHFWAPNWRTSIYGTYIEISHNGIAKAAICDQGAGGGTNSAFQGGLGCNPDWSSWAVGSRTQWDIVKGLYVGLDVLYQRINSASPGPVNIVFAGSGAKPTAFYFVEDQEAWVATWRIHRDVVP